MKTNIKKNIISQALLVLTTMILFSLQSEAQNATAAVPIGVGRQCTITGSSNNNDSVKYFNYNSTSNIFTTKSTCRPRLSGGIGTSGTPATSFTQNAASITYNPFDGNIYYTEIKTPAPYNSYTYRWPANGCPFSPLPIHIAFPNQFVAGVEFDPATGLGYQINFVDTTGEPATNPDFNNNVGQFTSAAVVNGLAAMSYYDVTNGDLRYVQSLSSNGQVWKTPVAVTTANNIGQYTSLLVVNGNPAIAYYDVTNGDLKYVRANDANGLTWGLPITLDAIGNVGQFTSLKIVNGNPAVSYYDVTNGDLKYVRASDASGTAWGVPVAVSVTNNVGQFSSLEIVNGNPAIAYYDVTNRDLLYSRSTDANGAAWAAPVNVEATNDVGQYASMIIVNGNPAIGYYDVTNGDLRYIRSTDANGTVWAGPLAVATTGTVGQFASLLVVNGNPAISYYNTSTTDLAYVRATNINGTTWGVPVFAEASGQSIGQNSSMIVVNGNPAICYYNVSSGDAKYIRSYDANGALWFKNTQVYNIELQQVNFTTGVLGVSRPLIFKDQFGATKYIYRTEGDIVMSPSGQLLAVYNNKYFTVNWKDYSTALPLKATMIDTLAFGTNFNLVGLAYADGKLVGSTQNSTICSSNYREIDIISGALSPITYNAGPLASIFTSADMTDITSGIGISKRIVSATENPVGSQTYDIVYEVIIQNFGGTPINNVQATDTLDNINGIFNHISGSITSFSGPAGISANPSYNGYNIPFVGDNRLLTPGGTLSNLPGQNTIKLQITCKIAGIMAGTIYTNQAYATATGLFGDPLRDASTDGPNPDLNNNSKPDDVGENQPTPLLISIVAQTPPCSALNNVLYNQDFGTGTGLSTVVPPAVLGIGVSAGTSTVGYTTTAALPVLEESATLSNNAINVNATDFVNLPDHTGNANGRMLIVNADAASSVMLNGGFTYPLCANQQYSLSFYAAFLGNASQGIICNALGGAGYINSKIKMRVRDGATGLIITQVSTPVISSNGWQQYGLKFVSPSSYTSLKFELINDAPGGCGNDIAIDDIQFGSCDPVLNVSVSGPSGCINGTTTFTGALSDPSVIPGAKQYQWQVSPAPGTGPWTNIASATAATYTINPILPSDTGKYYRILVAATGNIASPSCRFTSTGLILSGSVQSVSATSALKAKNNICPGIPVNLSIVGGLLGTGAVWKWYEGTCGATVAGTGATISVSPSVTTTYFVRAEGPCNNTACQQVIVTVSCDIDKDDDGIPDFVESALPAAFLDANSDGTINAYDATYSGFVDNNNDFINDNFQADGDSDNDGNPNYLDTDFAGRIDTNADGVDDRFDADKDGKINMIDLDSDNDGIPDVVEAYGVDTDGNGKIDNYTDTDGDGLSQNVDNNNTGAGNTGLGLGNIDLDGDGIPNFIDLDSDNDGIPDLVEVGGPDVNNDGKIDGAFVDVNSDGLHDSFINLGALLKTGIDAGGDGKADSYPNKNFDKDFRPNAYDLDSDGDGITDVIEAGLPDANLNGLVDGTIAANGWSTTISSLAVLTLTSTDADGKPNYLDIDSDNDGIPDNIEGMSTIGYLLPSTTDSDGDGLVDTYDNTIGFGGIGISVYNHDGDLLPDYLDLDSDGDGALDIVEGNDFNLNGIADDVVTLTGVDTDGDGLDDRFDALNSTTIVKGTSSNMGNSGTTSGDATPGTLSPVQKKVATQIDRDWRFVGTVLPVDILLFTATLKNNQVALNFTIATPQTINRVEIERSINNDNFIKVGTITDAIKINQAQTFNFNDDIAAISNTIIYYRLKIIATTGDVKYSNVLMVKRTTSSTAVLVSPNPVFDYFNVRFIALKDGQVTLKLIDNIGKTVLLQTQIVTKGSNTIKIDKLDKYSKGVYSLQLIVNNEIVTQKLILTK
jgi:uncharacterized repeat protein (TIGR01451 family)